MREFFSFCFDQLTDPLSLPLNPITEYIILAVIGMLAFILAFRLVGNMYDADVIGESVLGSIFHWVLRLVLFVSMWGITNAAIIAYRFLTEHLVILLVVFGGALLLLGAFFLVRHLVIQNRLKPIKETTQKL